MKTGIVENEDKGSEKVENSNLDRTIINELLERIKNLEQNKSTQIGPVNAGMGVDQFERLLNAVRPATGDDEFYKFDKIYNLGPDDFDPVGVLYTAPSTGIVIIDDRRNGVDMRTPSRKPIFFMYEGQIVSKADRGSAQNVNTFSCYLSRSKAEQEWLRGHTLYGVMFSESGKSALSQDTMRMKMLQAYLLGVSNLDSPALFKRCKDANLPVSSDVVMMRLALAEYQMKAEETSKENASQRMARETRENELFLGDTKLYKQPSVQVVK